MRKFFTAMLPLLLAPATVLGASTAAHASITTGCGTTSGGAYCSVYEDMNSGFCQGILTVDKTTYVNNEYHDASGTGYQCRFWMERNVNNTGWYDESGQLTLTPGNDYMSQDYWDGSGYQARLCFQFLWSGSSDPGAAHCTSAIGNL